MFVAFPWSKALSSISANLKTWSCTLDSTAITVTLTQIKVSLVQGSTAIKDNARPQG